MSQKNQENTGYNHRWNPTHVLVGVQSFPEEDGPLDKQPIWLTSAALIDCSHIWHELYLIAYTEVLGLVSCRFSSKPLGIGACERSWGDVKHIKTVNISHMGA